tara:strand:- start:736 stop:1758 length:1023 start_codon:yes stop_codon:yes gene_type:complete
MSVLCVIGVRPHAGKAACLAQAYRDVGQELNFYVTRQQKDFLAASIQPMDNFLAKTTSRISPIEFSYKAEAKNIGDFAKEIRSRCILSIGDTKTSLVAALAASESEIPLVHYESGLRSVSEHEILEDKIRKKIEALSKTHLVYNHISRENLINEGFSHSSIYVVGSLYEEIILRFNSWGNAVTIPKSILISIHRKENLQNRLIIKEIIDRISIFSDKYVTVITHGSNKNLDMSPLISYKSVRVVETMDVRSFIRFLKSHEYIVTDSAGICEQATLLEKKVLLLRKSTERPWLLSERTVLTSLRTMARDMDALSKIGPSRWHGSFDGAVSHRIVQAIRGIT